MIVSQEEWVRKKEMMRNRAGREVVGQPPSPQLNGTRGTRSLNEGILLRSEVGKESGMNELIMMSWGRG